jgi:Ca2+-binding EF-hand superfamily protein
MVSASDQSSRYVQLQPPLPTARLNFTHTHSHTHTRTLSLSQVDTNGDGVIDRAELAAHFAKTRGGEAADSLLEQLVRALDVNGDGVIDKEELQVAVVSCTTTECNAT